MRPCNKYILLLLYTCFVYQAFSQETKTDNVVFVEKKDTHINVYVSKGFVEPNDKSFTRLNVINDLNQLQETLEVDELDEEQANLAYSHARSKLDRAILFFNQEDIARYNDIIERIRLRLRELFGGIWDTGI
jgi:hypothetical protein